MRNGQIKEYIKQHLKNIGVALSEAQVKSISETTGYPLSVVIDCLKGYDVDLETAEAIIDAAENELDYMPEMND